MTNQLSHPAESATAHGFGATITTTARTGTGLYLVVGHCSPPEDAVMQVGGQIVVRFPDAPRLLAILPVESEPTIRRHPDVALAGSVMIDPARFAHFVRITNLDAGAAST